MQDGSAEFLDLSRVNTELSQLFGLARARDEVDFAMSLMPEMRGAQDPGWKTAEEAMHAFREGMDILRSNPSDRGEVRNLLYRYLCISEASGLYEVLRNLIGVIGSEIYRLWPFIEITERHSRTGKIITPNANRIFRELAQRATAVGLVGLTDVLSNSFDDDLRNAIAHADYIIWDSGLRLRRRNGGYPYELSWPDLSRLIRRGFCFLDLLNQHIDTAVKSYAKAREVVGRGSGNKIPFKYSIYFDPSSGAFGLSTSSPGGNTSPEFERAETLKSILGKQALVIVSYEGFKLLDEIEGKFVARGVAPMRKLFPSVAAYRGFLGELRTKDRSLFLHESETGGSHAFAFTSLGGAEAEAAMHLILPPAPVFTFESSDPAVPMGDAMD